MPMANKHGKVVTYKEELPSITCIALQSCGLVRLINKCYISNYTKPMALNIVGG